MLTLKQSMELAGENLLYTLSPDFDMVPFWSVSIDRDLRAKANMGGPGHNVGRWWDAMLRLEAATGFPIPDRLQDAMLGNLARCLDNPFGIAGRIHGEYAGSVFYHSQREVLLALACLVRYRHSDWAAEQGGRMVRALDRLILADGRWDSDRIRKTAAQHGITPKPYDFAPHEHQGVYLTHSHGRMLEALLEFYVATGDEATLALAARLAHYHLQHSTLADGTVPPGNPLHTHSLFGTYRGLLMFGRMTRRHEVVERIAKTYAATVRPHVKPSGFVAHDWGHDSKGETTSPGDAAQLALWLAQSGYPEHLDDAERLVRCRILPSQVTEPLGLTPRENEDRDSCRDLERRVLGAFGGMHRHPHGEALPTTDITAADLHTLCDLYTHIVEHTELGLQVNFHLDYEDEDVRIETDRTETGRLILHPKSRWPMLVRVPGWTPAESVRLSVNGEPRPNTWIGNSLFVPRMDGRAAVHVEYGLPATTIPETTDGVEYHISWRGDEVTGIRPNTDFLPFYPTAAQ